MNPVLPFTSLSWNVDPFQSLRLNSTSSSTNPNGTIENAEYVFDKNRFNATVDQHNEHNVCRSTAWLLNKAQGIKDMLKTENLPESTRSKMNAERLEAAREAYVRVKTAFKKSVEVCEPYLLRNEECPFELIARLLARRISMAEAKFASDDTIDAIKLSESVLSFAKDLNVSPEDMLDLEDNCRQFINSVLRDENPEPSDPLDPMHMFVRKHTTDRLRFLSMKRHASSIDTEDPFAENSYLADFISGSTIVDQHNMPESPLPIFYPVVV